MCDALRAPSQTLDRVFYFTTLPNFNPSKMKRHQTYITALENSRVDAVYGRFGDAWEKCGGKCGEVYHTFAEKETDVNLACGMIYDAVKDETDAIYVLTGDSDQVPAIRTVRLLAPKAETVAVFPIRRPLEDMKRVAHRTIQLGCHHFTKNQFPNPLRLRSGRDLACPESWIKPAPTPSAPAA
jgi:uncharacterized LabA/DUF88 family protein